ncbi:BATF isoform 2 [Pongo abelii]|uniref:Basic leucine zipper transcriptional factor ATF-like n=1 Tax=Pongo abelii TaxID=9601 RepID=H2NLU6_PONAB|nr:BATF isoform 2 [Pongo abelii]
MPHSSDSSDSSFSRSPPPGKQDSSDDVRRVQRREKNRIAAQKSRQRQTQKSIKKDAQVPWHRARRAGKGYFSK